MQPETIQLHKDIIRALKSVIAALERWIAVKEKSQNQQ
jgi:hypothetical protein